MRVVLTADTHVPKRARDLPGPLWRAIEDTDVVVHAGDWVDVALLDELEARAARVIGVYGNNDGHRLRARLPEVARVELAGLRLAVVHETGPAAAEPGLADRPTAPTGGHVHDGGNRPRPVE
jgi:putative phosphoesterase